MNRITLENPSIWITTAEGSYKLSDCTSKLKTVEDVQTLTLVGSDTEYKVKSYRTLLVICDNVANASVSRLKKVKSFDLRFEPIKVSNEHCTMKVSEFNDIKPVELDLKGEWIFDVTNNISEIKEAFPGLVIE